MKPPLTNPSQEAQHGAEAIQELYDATTVLWSVLIFTHAAEDLLSSGFDVACRRLLAARAAVRRLGLVEPVDAAQVPPRELPPPFDVPARAVLVSEVHDVKH